MCSDAPIACRRQQLTYTIGVYKPPMRLDPYTYAGHTGVVDKEQIAPLASEMALEFFEAVKLARDALEPGHGSRAHH